MSFKSGIYRKLEVLSDFTSDIEGFFREVEPIGGTTFSFIDGSGNTHNIAAGDYSKIIGKKMFINTILSSTDCTSVWAWS